MLTIIGIGLGIGLLGLAIKYGWFIIAIELLGEIIGSLFD
jgi:hypothetical protein